MATASGSYPADCEFESHRVNKVCTICKGEFPTNEFNKNRSKKDGLQPHCRPCSHKRFKRYYALNREKQKSEVMKRKRAVTADNRRRLIEHFASHPCVDCGESDVLVLELDHVRGRKKQAVSRYCPN